METGTPGGEVGVEGPRLLTYDLIIEQTGTREGQHGFFVKNYKRFFDTLLYNLFHNARLRLLQLQQQRQGLTPDKQDTKGSGTAILRTKKKKSESEGSEDDDIDVFTLSSHQKIKNKMITDADIAQLLDIFLVYVTNVEDRLAFAVWWHIFAIHFLRYCYPLPPFFDERQAERPVRRSAGKGEYEELKVTIEGGGKLAKKEGQQGEGEKSDSQEEGDAKKSKEEIKWDAFTNWKENHVLRPLTLPLVVQHSIIAMLYEWLKDPYMSDVLVTTPQQVIQNRSKDFLAEATFDDQPGNEKQRELLGERIMTLSDDVTCPVWDNIPKVAETIFRVCEECCTCFQKGLKNLMPTLSLALNTFYHLCWDYPKVQSLLSFEQLLAHRKLFAGHIALYLCTSTKGKEKGDAAALVHLHQLCFEMLHRLADSCVTMNKATRKSFFSSMSQILITHTHHHGEELGDTAQIVQTCLLLWIRSEVTTEKFWRPVQDIIGDSLHQPQVLIAYQTIVREIVQLVVKKIAADKGEKVNAGPLPALPVKFFETVKWTDSSMRFFLDMFKRLLEVYSKGVNVTWQRGTFLGMTFLEEIVNTLLDTLAEKEELFVVIADSSPEGFHLFYILEDWLVSIINLTSGDLKTFKKRALKLYCRLFLTIGRTIPFKNGTYFDVYETLDAMLLDPVLSHCVLRHTQNLFSLCFKNCPGIIPSYLQAISNVMNQPAKQKTKAAAVQILCSLVCYPVSKLKECTPLPPTAGSNIYVNSDTGVQKKGALRRFVSHKSLRRSKKDSLDGSLKDLNKEDKTKGKDKDKDKEKETDTSTNGTNQPQTEQPASPTVKIGTVEIPKLSNLDTLPTRDRSRIVLEQEHGILDTKQQILALLIAILKDKTAATKERLPCLHALSTVLINDLHYLYALQYQTYGPHNIVPAMVNDIKTDPSEKMENRSRAGTYSFPELDEESETILAQNIEIMLKLLMRYSLSLEDELITKTAVACLSGLASVPMYPMLLFDKSDPMKHINGIVKMLCCNIRSAEDSHTNLWEYYFAALAEWLVLPFPFLDDGKVVPFILDALQVALVPDEQKRGTLAINSEAEAFLALDQIYQRIPRNKKDFNIGTARAEQLLMQLLYTYKYRAGNELQWIQEESDADLELIDELLGQSSLDVPTPQSKTKLHCFWFDDSIIAITELPPVTTPKGDGNVLKKMERRLRIWNAFGNFTYSHSTESIHKAKGSHTHERKPVPDWQTTSWNRAQIPTTPTTPRSNSTTAIDDKEKEGKEDPASPSTTIGQQRERKMPATKDAVIIPLPLGSHLSLYDSNFGIRPHAIEMSTRFKRSLHLLKNDAREKHKIAVFYVEKGKSDQTSVLLNRSYSQAFYEFCLGLGSLVNVQNHKAYLGGLDPSAGSVDILYYSSLNIEVVFHVVPFFPPMTPEQIIAVKRHVGNDSVYIVWSEENVDYEQTIVTQFGQATIVIYPQPDNLYRIQLKTKVNDFIFYPLYDGMVLPRRIAAPLIRLTAINANADLRRSNPAFKTLFWARKEIIQQAIERHGLPATQSAIVIKPISGKKERSRSVSPATAKLPIAAAPLNWPASPRGGSKAGGGGSAIASQIPSSPGPTTATTPATQSAPVAVLINHTKAQHHQIWMEGMQLITFAFPPFSPMDLILPPPTLPISIFTATTPRELPPGATPRDLPTSPRGGQQVRLHRTTVFDKMKKTKEGMTSLYTSLKVLSLDYNRLSSLPSMLFFTFLQELNLCHNNFTHFPKEILHLVGLVKLDISYNRIVDIPGLLTKKLAALKVLHMNHNCITYLPVSVFFSSRGHQKIQLFVDRNPLLTQRPRFFGEQQEDEKEEDPLVELVDAEAEYRKHCRIPSLVAISGKHILRTCGNDLDSVALPNELKEYLAARMHLYCDSCGRKYVSPAFAWQRKEKDVFGYPSLWIGARACSFQCGKKLNPIPPSPETEIRILSGI